MHFVLVVFDRRIRVRLLVPGHDLIALGTDVIDAIDPDCSRNEYLASWEASWTAVEGGTPSTTWMVQRQCVVQVNRCLLRRLARGSAGPPDACCRGRAVGRGGRLRRGPANSAGGVLRLSRKLGM